MRFLATVLTATVICAILLVAVVYRIGAQPDAQPRTGLTAATVLGTEDMSTAREPEARREVDKPALSKLVNMPPSRSDGRSKAGDPQG
jgi:hypothetical protein